VALVLLMLEKLRQR